MENRWNRKVGDFPLLKLPSRPPVAEDLEEQGLRAMPQQTEEPGNPNSKYYPKRPYGTYWKNANKEYFQYTIKHQTNRDYYKITNPDGTVTYAYRTFDERFYYSEPNTNKWHRFKPDGYKTYAQQIESLKNIAAATGVFGEKYQKLLEFIFLSLATLAAGGPAGRALFNVVYQFLNQLITARIKGEPFSPDYFDLLIDTIPINTTPAGEFYVELVKEIFKAFIEISSKKGVQLVTKEKELKEEFVNSITAAIIAKYRIKLMGSNLGITEREMVDAISKAISLIGTTVIFGLYEMD